MTSWISAIDRSWTLFLDRDGVINRRIVDGYVKSWDEFEFLPGVPGAMSTFARQFTRIIVVSNQQGVGKGLMTASDVESLHRSMTEAVVASGGRIDGIYYCPALASDRSFRRKPGIGMGLEAKKHFPEIRFIKSIMIGDSRSDMIFGKRLGMKTVLVASEPLIPRENPLLVDMLIPNLATFATFLK